MGVLRGWRGSQQAVWWRCPREWEQLQPQPRTGQACRLAGLGGTPGSWGTVMSGVPCVPARYRGGPPRGDARHRPSSQSGHPGGQDKRWVGFRGGRMYGIPKAQRWAGGSSYLGGQCSPDADYHLLPVMVHSHIEGGFVDLEGPTCLSVASRWSADVTPQSLPLWPSPHHGKRCRRCPQLSCSRPGSGGGWPWHCSHSSCPPRW